MFGVVAGDVNTTTDQNMNLIRLETGLDPLTSSLVTLKGRAWQKSGGCAWWRHLEGEVPWQVAWGKGRSQLWERGYWAADCPHRQSVQQLDDKLSFTDGGGVPPHYDTCIYLFISVKDSIFLQFLTRASQSTTEWYLCLESELETSSDKSTFFFTLVLD